MQRTNITKYFQVNKRSKEGGKLLKVQDVLKLSVVLVPELHETLIHPALRDPSGSGWTSLSSVQIQNKRKWKTSRVLLDST